MIHAIAGNARYFTSTAFSVARSAFGTYAVNVRMHVDRAVPRYMDHPGIVYVSPPDTSSKIASRHASRFAACLCQIFATLHARVYVSPRACRDMQKSADINDALKLIS